MRNLCKARRKLKRSKSQSPSKLKSLRRTIKRCKVTWKTAAKTLRQVRRRTRRQHVVEAVDALNPFIDRTASKKFWRIIKYHNSGRTCPFPLHRCPWSSFEDTLKFGRPFGNESGFLANASSTCKDNCMNGWTLPNWTPQLNRLDAVVKLATGLARKSPQTAISVASILRKTQLPSSFLPHRLAPPPGTRKRARSLLKSCKRP